MRRRVWFLAPLLLFLIAGADQISAIEYISNLGNRWIDPGNPTANSIGDIHTPAPYGPFLGTFYTGTAPAISNGGNQAAAVDAVIITNPPAFSGFKVEMVTLEFIHHQTASLEELRRLWMDMVIRICGDGLTGELGNPIIDERQTQWPYDRNPSFCTVYVDFLPLTNIILRPSTMYQVKIEGVDVGVLFSTSSNFTTPTDWRMGPTITRCPWAAGEFMKFAVAATPVAGSGPTTSLLTAFRSGAELVLTWPTDTGLRLYSANPLNSANWTPVSGGWVTTGGQNVLRVPLSAGSRYFRLQP